MGRLPKRCLRLTGSIGGICSSPGCLPVCKFLFNNIVTEYEKPECINVEIEYLAKKYVESGIIPENKLEDALHIAFATHYEFDILLSWNFKHLANIKKQIEVNAVNETEGHTKTLNLLNPMEMLYEK